MVDNVPQDVKLQRQARMSELSRKIFAELNQELVNTEQLVLIEGVSFLNFTKFFEIFPYFLNFPFQNSKRSENEFQGRTDGYVKTIFPKHDNLKPGDYVKVHITDSNSQTLRGNIISKSSITEFFGE